MVRGAKVGVTPVHVYVTQSDARPMCGSTSSEVQQITTSCCLRWMRCFSLPQRTSSALRPYEREVTRESGLLPNLQAHLGRHLDAMANAHIGGWVVGYIRISQDARGPPRLRQERELPYLQDCALQRKLGQL